LKVERWNVERCDDGVFSLVLARNQI